MERRADLIALLVFTFIAEALSLISLAVLTVIAMGGILPPELAYSGWEIFALMMFFGAVVGVVLSGTALILSDWNDNQRGKLLSVIGLAIGLLLLIAGYRRMLIGGFGI